MITTSKTLVFKNGGDIKLKSCSETDVIVIELYNQRGESVYVRLDYGELEELATLVEEMR